MEDTQNETHQVASFKISRNERQTEHKSSGMENTQHGRLHRMKHIKFCNWDI